MYKNNKDVLIMIVDVIVGFYIFCGNKVVN